VDDNLPESVPGGGGVSIAGGGGVELRIEFCMDVVDCQTVFLDGPRAG